MVVKENLVWSRDHYFTILTTHTFMLFNLKRWQRPLGDEYDLINDNFMELIFYLISDPQFSELSMCCLNHLFYQPTNSFTVHVI